MCTNGRHPHSQQTDECTYWGRAFPPEQHTLPGHHFPPAAMVLAVQYSLWYQLICASLAERGVQGDRSILNGWLRPMDGRPGVATA